MVVKFDLEFGSALLSKNSHFSFLFLGFSLRDKCWQIYKKVPLSTDFSDICNNTCTSSLLKSRSRSVSPLSSRKRHVGSRVN